MAAFKICSMWRGKHWNTAKWRWRSGSTQQEGHWVLHPNFNHFTFEPQNTTLLWIKEFITLKFFCVSNIFWLRNDFFVAWINKLSLLWDCTERVHTNSKRSSYDRLNYYSCHYLHILTVLSWRLSSLLCPYDLRLGHMTCFGQWIMRVQCTYVVYSLDLSSSWEENGPDIRRDMNPSWYQQSQRATHRPHVNMNKK